MQIHTETKKFGNVVHTHKVCGGTYYSNDTADEVIRALERAREGHWRVRLFCGDVKTGVAWEEEHDIMGTIGRSTGSIKSPLLIANARSMGGPALLDSCIVGVRRTGTAGKKWWLYKHPAFTVGSWGVQILDSGVHSVQHNGTEYAREKSWDKAVRLAQFMQGWRDSK